MKKRGRSVLSLLLAVMILASLSTVCAYAEGLIAPSIEASQEETTKERIHDVLSEGKVAYVITNKEEVKLPFEPDDLHGRWWELLRESDQILAATEMFEKDSETWLKIYYVDDDLWQVNWGYINIDDIKDEVYSSNNIAQFAGLDTAINVACNVDGEATLLFVASRYTCQEEVK